MSYFLCREHVSLSSPLQLPLVSSLQTAHGPVLSVCYLQHSRCIALTSPTGTVTLVDTAAVAHRLTHPCGAVAAPIRGHYQSLHLTAPDCWLGADGAALSTRCPYKLKELRAIRCTPDSVVASCVATVTRKALQLCSVVVDAQCVASIPQDRASEAQACYMYLLDDGSVHGVSAGDDAPFDARMLTLNDDSYVAAVCAYQSSTQEPVSVTVRKLQWLRVRRQHIVRSWYVLTQGASLSLLLSTFASIVNRSDVQQSVPLATAPLVTLRDALELAQSQQLHPASSGARTASDKAVVASGLQIYGFCCASDRLDSWLSLESIQPTKRVRHVAGQTHHWLTGIVTGVDEAVTVALDHIDEVVAVPASSVRLIDAIAGRDSVVEGDPVYVLLPVTWLPTVEALIDSPSKEPTVPPLPVATKSEGVDIVHVVSNRTADVNGSEHVAASFALGRALAQVPATLFTATLPREQQLACDSAFAQSVRGALGVSSVISQQMVCVAGVKAVCLRQLHSKAHAQLRDALVTRSSNPYLSGVNSINAAVLKSAYDSIALSDTVHRIGDCDEATSILR